jgi:hypothetical protein
MNSTAATFTRNNSFPVTRSCRERNREKMLQQHRAKQELDRLVGSATKTTKVYHPGSRKLVVLREAVSDPGDLQRTDVAEEEQSGANEVLASSVDVRPEVDREGEEAKEIVKERIEAAYVNPLVMHSVLASLVHLGELTVAISLVLEEMPRRGCPPHIPSFITLIAALTKAERYTEAVEAFHSAWRDCISSPPRNRGSWRLVRSEVEALVDSTLTACARYLSNVYRNK